MVLLFEVMRLFPHLRQISTTSYFERLTDKETESEDFQFQSGTSNYPHIFKSRSWFVISTSPLMKFSFVTRKH
jgi:hypothetical protein